MRDILLALLLCLVATTSAEAAIRPVADPGGPYYARMIADETYLPVHVDAYGSALADTYWWDTDGDGLFGPEDTDGSYGYLGTSVGDGVGPELTVKSELLRMGRTVFISLKALGPDGVSYPATTWINCMDVPLDLFADADVGGPYSVQYASDLILTAGEAINNASTVDWQIFSQPRTIWQRSTGWTGHGLTATFTFDELEALLGYGLEPGDTFYVRQRVTSPEGFAETSTAAVVVTIPEPATLGLLCAGYLVLIGRKAVRRRCGKVGVDCCRKNH